MKPEFLVTLPDWRVGLVFTHTGPATYAPASSRLGMNVRPIASSHAQATAADGPAVALRPCRANANCAFERSFRVGLGPAHGPPPHPRGLASAWRGPDSRRCMASPTCPTMTRASGGGGTQAFTLTPLHGCRPAPAGSPEAVIDHSVNVLAHNTQCATLISAKQAIVQPDACMPAWGRTVRCFRMNCRTNCRTIPTEPGAGDDGRHQETSSRRQRPSSLHARVKAHGRKARWSGVERASSGRAAAACQKRSCAVPRLFRSAR